MTIQEQLNVINETFHKLHSDFVRFDTQKQALAQRYCAQTASIHEKWEKERERIAALKEDVLKYYRIAKDNSPKELNAAGAAAQAPDIARLNRMVEQISSSRNDPVAGQVIDLASGYIAYLDGETGRIDSKESSEMQGLEAGRSQESGHLSQQKKQVLADCERYLRGKDVMDLVALFEAIHRDYEITEAYFTTWGQAQKRKRMMLFGFQQFALDVPQPLCGVLKDSLKEHFDETSKMVNCPCGYTTDSYERIDVEYVDANEALMKKGVQALALNYLRYFRPTECRISVFDDIHYNADVLGPLSALGGEKNSFVEKTASDARSLKQGIALLADYYRNVEAKLGTQTLYEYNQRQKPENRIPLRIVIINRIKDLSRSMDDSDLAYVINNAGKFGITALFLSKSTDGGSKGKDREKRLLPVGENRVRVISDADGRFYIQNGAQWLPFKWLDAPASLPSDFVARVLTAARPKEIGSKYFSRYSMHVPARSTNKRKPITVPFAIDEDDHPVSCSFENDLFAAYIMGAAGSGKSTLLHTIISGLIMNYHPDEVELWLMDFKMLEFKRYVDHRPPHVKYILLEKSEDLVFDMIDHLTALLDKRQELFSRYGWSKLTDVPVDQNVPAVFVIIDEFAQMSQILKETKGSGYGSDYTIKLENLLAKGRALGLKFIFASQTYTTGVSGLTETACKQIQMRFALKNTPDEIRQTLGLSSDQITPALSQAIASMPAYETIFKWADAENKVHIGLYRNMYTVGTEIETLVDKINAAITPVKGNGPTTNATYIDKKPVLIDGSRPKTFKSQIPYYQDYESRADADDLEESDTLIYPGVPCSFSLARPFVLCNATAENILIAGGDRDSEVNVILSILNSYSKRGGKVELWAHERSSIFKKYRASVFSKLTKRTDLEEICSQIAGIKRDIQRRTVEEKMIVCLGYENLAADLDVLGEGATEPTVRERPSPRPNASQPDMNEILRRVQACSDPEEKRRIIEEYNRSKDASESAAADAGQEEGEFAGVYDARDDVEWIIKRAPNYGLHFLFCFDRGRDFMDLRLDENAFRHKILFPMSRDEALTIMGSRKANEIDAGTCVYGSGKETFTFRPHIYRGVSCNGWIIDDKGDIVRKG